MIDGFHFLRPWALVLLPVAGLLTYALFSLRDTRQSWRGVIDEHLLDALIMRGSKRRRLLPVHVLGLVWSVSILALAGPAWQREPSPFATDDAAIVVVIEVTKTMTASDIQPTRLERAAQKVVEFLDERSDADCALFAYAGSAHRAMPLTRDSSVIGYFARALSPQIMPQEGDAAAAAIAAANDELRRAQRPGSIVLISDGVAPDQVERIVSSDSVPVHVLAMGARGAGAVGPALDRGSLRRVARATGGSVVDVTPDARDVEELARSVVRAIGTVASDTGTEVEQGWKDAGYWLLFPLAALVLLWSRRGWSIALPAAEADA